MYYVYKLIDPRNDLPFYIGKGKGDRMQQHLREAKLEPCLQVNKIKCSVINNILSNGLQLIYEQIPMDTEAAAYLHELELIKQYGKRCDGSGILTNVSNGGYGGYGESSGTAIEQYSVTGLFIRSYQSLTDAAYDCKIHKSTVCAALNGRTLLAGGYRWCYVGETLRPYLNRSTSSVDMFNFAGEYIQTFKTIKQASKSTNIHTTGIIECCTRVQHTAGGYRWAYTGELPTALPIGYVVPGTRKYASYDDNGKLVQVFNTIKEATNATGAVPSGIVDRCAGRVTYKTGGYYWKYYDG